VDDGTVVVRPIEEVDVPSVVAILIGGAIGGLVEDASRLDDYWSAVLETRDRDGDVLVADVDGEVVGVCQVMVFRTLGHVGGRVAELENVHVRANRRSRGIGANLLKAAENLARQRGCFRLQLTSNAARADAHRFYAAHDYQPSHKGFKKYLD
jgi:GNAT superfamily N-acetyltransferase